MPLDFAWMQKLSAGGLTKEAAAQKDELLSKGYSVTDGTTPFDAECHRGAQDASGRPLADQRTNAQEIKPRPAQGNLRPFLSISGVKYRTLYRQACNFHERNNPPDHAAGTAYWERVAIDFNQTMQKNDGNPFLLDLLSAIMDELQREWNQTK